MKKPKISKVKYCIYDFEYICPECGHKFLKETDGEYARKFTACNEKFLSSTENYCPYCNHKFDNTELLSYFAVIKKYVKDPIALKLLENTFFITLNANDFFMPACADDEMISHDVLALYFILVYEYNLKPVDALDGILEWNRGCLEFGKKVPSKALKIIRKLLGHKWNPVPREFEFKEN